MKKVLLSFLLMLLCGVKASALTPPPPLCEPYHECIQVINGVQYITFWVDCIDTPAVALIVWYEAGGVGGAPSGPVVPSSYTFNSYPYNHYEVTYPIDATHTIPPHECTKIHWEAHYNGYVPNYPTIGAGYYLVCPCDEEVPCRPDFTYCVSYDEVNEKWNTTMAPFNYPTWIDYYQLTVDGTPVTTTMPGTYSFTGGSHTICIEAFYYDGTQSCKKCMEVCFPAEPKPGKETLAVGQSNGQFSQVKLYPNPANNITKLEFNLQESEQLNIQLLDISGRIIKSIRNEKATAGYHTVEINTADVPSGMYIIQMETGKASANYRLSVIK